MMDIVVFLEIEMVVVVGVMDVVVLWRLVVVMEMVALMEGW